jgi:hypothetical protein
MKFKTLQFVAGAGGAMALGSVACAAYQGLTMHLHTQAMVGQGMGPPALRDVWRVYALFSDPDDYLTTVAGSPTLGNLIIRTLNPTGTGSGGLFINPIGGGATPPYFTYIGTQVQWDTYVTIGLSSWGDPNGPAHQMADTTGLSPGFLQGIWNTGFLNSDNVGWFTPGPVPQGRAGNGVNFGGTWGVLFLQLTVNAGNRVAGTVAIGGVNNNPAGGGIVFQTNADQTFNYIPAPGILAAFGLAGVVGMRNRRR